jgi:hypothetical protein
VTWQSQRRRPLISKGTRRGWWKLEVCVEHSDNILEGLLKKSQHQFGGKGQGIGNLLQTGGRLSPSPFPLCELVTRGGILQVIDDMVAIDSVVWYEPVTECTRQHRG